MKSCKCYYSKEHYPVSQLTLLIQQIKLVNAYIAISSSRCSRVVNGFNFEAQTQNHKPEPEIYF